MTPEIRSWSFHLWVRITLGQREKNSKGRQFTKINYPNFPQVLNFLITFNQSGPNGVWMLKGTKTNLVIKCFCFMYTTTKRKIESESSYQLREFSLRVLYVRGVALWSFLKSILLFFPIFNIHLIPSQIPFPSNTRYYYINKIRGRRKTNTSNCFRQWRLNL